MKRVTAIFLSCVLLTASSLLASSVEETYQAALTQEKGEGNLEEAIRLYQQVIEAHEKGEGDENMAARAQLRIGVCQEKLGLAQARQTYEAVRDKYPDQSQVGAEAARRLGSTHQREAVIEEPSHRTASESYVRRQLQQVMERAKQQKELTERQLEAIQRQLTEQTKRQIEQVKQLTEQTKRQMEQAKQGTGADSVFIDEQVRRQLEATQRQMEQAERQLEQQMKQAERQIEQAVRQLERQLEAIQRQGVSFERIRPRHFLEGGSDQQYYHYANTPPVIFKGIVPFLEGGLEQVYQAYAYTPPEVPYPHEEVAKMPMQWKFRLEVDGLHPQRHAYAAPDFDDSEWATIDIGRAWEDQGYAGYDEGAWYRTTFTVAADSVRPVLMAFGGVDKDAFLYVNGQLVGQHHVWNQPFILDISDHVVRDGENAVALYVYDGKLMGGVYGLINVHQPTNEVETDDFAANRGGSLDMVHRRTIGTQVRVLKPSYSSYAHRPPRIPYPHRKVGAVPMQWKFCLDVGEPDPQRNREYANPDFDDSEWADISIGQAWEDQGYPGYDEGAWYRTQIEVNAEKGRPVHLAFGGVDKDAYVYVNGHWVGEHRVWNQPFILDISDHVVRDGENTVALYVYDGTGMGGVYGLINVHQPTSKENLDRYLANRGGSAKRSFWSRFF